MLYLIYFILIFTGFRFFSAFINLLSNLYLKNKKTDNEKFISVLIPARNEENNIKYILNDLSQQKYSNFEIIIYNDSSTDNTMKVVQSYMKDNENIQLLTGTELPNGWLGKNHACHKLAEKAEGELFMFLDADVRLSTSFLSLINNRFQTNKLDFISIFPYQIMKTIGELITVPLMNTILLSLLPLKFVRISNRHSFSAANGQFIAVKSDVYKKYLLHKWFKNNPVEDIAMVRFLKKLKYRTETLLGGKNIQCRMYHTFNEAIRGFSKNILTFFGNSYIFTFVYLLCTNFAIIPLLIYSDYQLLFIYLLISVLLNIFIAVKSKQNIIIHFLFLIPRQFVFIYLIFKSIIGKQKKTIQWKGRYIYN